MARRHRHAGQQLAQSSCGSGLVDRIGIGVEKNHGDRLDAGGRDCVSDSVDRFHGKRRADISHCIEPLDHFETQVPGTKGSGGFECRL